MSAPASRSPSDVIRMTEKQAREAHKLVRKECCNYVDGLCVALDCPCPQLITRSLNCKWFHHAVLPGNTSLYVEITGDRGKTKACAACGDKKTLASCVIGNEFFLQFHMLQPFIVLNDNTAALMSMLQERR